MTRRTCDGRVPLIAKYEHTQADDVVAVSLKAVFFKDWVKACTRVTAR